MKRNLVVLCLLAITAALFARPTLEPDLIVSLGPNNRSIEVAVPSEPHGVYYETLSKARLTGFKGEWGYSMSTKDAPPSRIWGRQLSLKEDGSATLKVEELLRTGSGGYKSQSELKSGKWVRRGEVAWIVWDKTFEERSKALPVPCLETPRH